MPAAAALDSTGFYIARALGPAVGGVVVSWLGTGANFLLNAASFLATIVVLFRWTRARRTSSLSANDLLAQRGPDSATQPTRQSCTRFSCDRRAYRLLKCLVGVAAAGGSRRQRTVLQRIWFVVRSTGLRRRCRRALLPRLRDRLSADVRVAGPLLC
jgi:hypothetical protein